MSSWNFKYDSLDEGKSAWYWHKRDKEWEPILVRKDRLGNKTYIRCASNLMEVTEDFPNGPACLNPEEMKRIYND